MGSGNDYDQEVRRKILEKKRQEDREKRLKQEKKRRVRAFLILIILIVAAGGIIFWLDFRHLKHAGKYASDSRNQTKILPEDTDAALTVGTGMAEASNSDASASDAPFQIQLTFVGDVELASNLEDTSPGSILACEESQPDTWFFDGVRSCFEKDDFTTANCENCFSDRELSIRQKPGQVSNPGQVGQTLEDGSTAIMGYWFKAPVKAASIFSANSIEAVSIDNNHSHDYGDEGFEDTQKALEEAGTDWGYKDKVIYYKKNHFTVAVVCVSFYYEEEGYEHLKYLEEAEKHSDYQVVFFHGGREGIHQPEDWKKNVCHAFADDGADLIIGSHPHVLQPRETCQGKDGDVNIVYSLGNFCFGGNSYPENRTLIYQMTLQINQGKVTDTEENMIPCYVYTGGVNQYQPAVIENEDEKNRVLDFMDGKADSPL